MALVTSSASAKGSHLNLNAPRDRDRERDNGATNKLGSFRMRAVKMMEDVHLRYQSEYSNVTANAHLAHTFPGHGGTLIAQGDNSAQWIWIT